MFDNFRSIILTMPVHINNCVLTMIEMYIFVLERYSHVKFQSPLQLYNLGLEIITRACRKQNRYFSGLISRITITIIQGLIPLHQAYVKPFKSPEP